MNRRTPAANLETYIAEPLFDDATFDEVEQTVNTIPTSYDHARPVHDVETFHIPEITKEPSEGVSVELGARALALHNIMATYNQLNRTMGANIVASYTDSSFDTRYRHPDEIREKMGHRAAVMIHHNKADFQTLNATDELIAAGFDKTQVERQERRIQADLLNEYGPGKAYADERKKVVKKAETAAKKANQK